MSVCISKYVLAKVKDSEVYSLFEFTLELAEKHLHVLKDIFKAEKLDLPIGFTNKDVNHAGFLFHLATTYYAAAMITSMRIDVAGHYDASILRDLKTISSFGRIMIRKGWIEKLPQADDRKELS
ncbi:DUF3231 family protein [Priestia aryabhattai]|nr:DUF3231 family protein [Priestia aryabhattai]MBU3569156.1 DUF3231 family protein [Priestia aryabhattai]